MPDDVPPDRRPRTSDPKFVTGYRDGLDAGAFVAPRLRTDGYAPSSRLGRDADPVAEPGTLFGSEVLAGVVSGVVRS